MVYDAGMRRFPASRAWLAVLASSAVLVASAPAAYAQGSGDDPDERSDDASKRARELARRAGERVAADDFEGALTLFKRALALKDTGKVRCNIGVAYFKLERWAQAHLHLGLCLKHADTLRASNIAEMSKAYAYVEKQLARGEFSQVAFDITPAGARVEISSLDDDGFNAPRVVWLPLGEHRIAITAPGHEPLRETLETRDRKRTSIERTLDRKPAPRGPERTGDSDGTGSDQAAPKTGTDRPETRPINPVPLTGTVDPVRPSQLPPWIATGVAVVALVGAISFHDSAVSTRNRLKELPSGLERDQLIEDLKRQRNLMAGMYGVTAVTTGVAVYLWMRALRAPRRAGESASGDRGESTTARHSWLQPTVGASIAPSSAGVWMRWTM